jgi:SAM-dependent methyltransferase
MIAKRTEQAAVRYRGEIATGYEARRREQPKWQAEDRIVRQMLGDLPEGTTVLDIPVGTGRFIPFYEERGFNVVGLDISSDMLAHARRKITKPELIAVRRGDIFALETADRGVTVAVAIRILNKIGAEDVPRALKELQRVTRDMIVFNVRIWTPGCKWRHALPMDVVTGAIEPGWQIVEDLPIHEDDFRMIKLERSGEMDRRHRPAGKRQERAAGPDVAAEVA